VPGRFSFIINEVIDPPPQISPDSVTLEFGKPFDPLEGSVLDSGFSTVTGNDLSTDSRFTITIEVPPTHGTVTINPDGTFHYVHDRSGVLMDEFVYRVTNEDGIFSLATVSINIEPPFEAAFPGTEEPVAPPTLPTDEETEEEETVDESDIEDEAEDSDEESGDEQMLGNRQSVDFNGEANGFGGELGGNESLNVMKLLQRDSIERNNADNGYDEQILALAQHNNASTADYTADRMAITQSSFDVVFEVSVTRARDVVDNPSFLQGLSELGNELQRAEEENSSRYQLGSDSALGVSISVTAGVLAWVLRGGSLIASLMTATPLWSQLDPVRVFSHGKDGHKRDDRAGDDVEELFNAKQ
jgi:hypothetical protein